MTTPDKPNAKKRKKSPKKRLPVFDPDQDFSTVFREQPLSKKSGPAVTNKHGLPVIEEIQGIFFSDEADSSPDPASKADQEAEDPKESEEDFAALLEESLKGPGGFRKKKPPPMPLKRRIKRYPSPEAELDLHGFTALGAQMKTRSFITSCKFQGYFTLRLIVGKGLHSESGAVLPDVVEDLLKTLKKENLVLAYEWEGKKKARSGAVIVYLKQFDD